MEYVVYSCRAHVFEIDPVSKKEWRPSSAQAVSISFFYNPATIAYRIHAFEGSKQLINTNIVATMKFTKTSQKFGQWTDPVARTVYGLGFGHESDLLKFEQQFLNAKNHLANPESKSKPEPLPATPVQVVPHASHSAGQLSPMTPNSLPHHPPQYVPSTPSTPLHSVPEGTPKTPTHTKHTVDNGPPSTHASSNLVSSSSLGSLDSLDPGTPTGGRKGLPSSNPGLLEDHRTLSSRPSTSHSNGTPLGHHPDESSSDPISASQEIDDKNRTELYAKLSALKYRNERLENGLSASSQNMRRLEAELTSSRNNNAKLKIALQESCAHVEGWKTQLGAWREETLRLKKRVAELEDATQVTTAKRDDARASIVAELEQRKWDFNLLQSEHEALKAENNDLKEKLEESKKKMEDALLSSKPYPSSDTKSSDSGDKWELENEIRILKSEVLVLNEKLKEQEELPRQDPLANEWKSRFQRMHAEFKVWQDTFATKISDLDDLHTVFGELLKQSSP